MKTARPTIRFIDCRFNHERFPFCLSRSNCVRADERRFYPFLSFSMRTSSIGTLDRRTGERISRATIDETPQFVFKNFRFLPFLTVKAIRRGICLLFYIETLFMKFDQLRRYRLCRVIFLKDYFCLSDLFFMHYVTAQSKLQILLEGLSFLLKARLTEGLVYALNSTGLYLPYLFYFQLIFRQVIQD